MSAKLTFRMIACEATGIMKKANSDAKNFPKKSDTNGPSMYAPKMEPTVVAITITDDQANTSTTTRCGPVTLL
ncbi:hypothetical protein Y032_0080g1350 [Ancylostoma ceylanicum]|uniref:Uncharacterized protein n=1 Tax=Ancylostoma ceylanicum TaxID=53326 RepID=A0A016TSK2_9BILA|nr:hypothetical protein Y032_0080g1350 [Ancylostoma ceylanicum]